MEHCTCMACGPVGSCWACDTVRGVVSASCDDFGERWNKGKTVGTPWGSRCSASIVDLNTVTEVCILENWPDPSSPHTQSSRQDCNSQIGVLWVTDCESVWPAVLCWRMRLGVNSNRILAHPAFDAFFAFIVSRLESNRRIRKKW